jgi:hypothetical protein
VWTARHIPSFYLPKRKLNRIMHPESGNTPSRTSANGSPIPCFIIPSQGRRSSQPAITFLLEFELPFRRCHSQTLLGKKPMTDRTARDEVMTAFVEFLDDRITAFDFDERLGSIQSRDRTVNEVIGAAWSHYDDCTDHNVILTKAEWDYFQRLMLILRSDAEASLSQRDRGTDDPLQG